MRAIAEKIGKNTQAVLAKTSKQLPPRAAATRLAVERVHAAMSYRR